MRLEITDFNNAGVVIESEFANEYDELAAVLLAMPPHLKASGQKNREEFAVFDPVAVNLNLKSGLKALDASWQGGVPMPRQFAFLGTDVDFINSGLLVEAQFSHYSFLLNNTLRSELLYKSHEPIGGHPVRCMVVVAKAKSWPAANSSLYAEQAVYQIGALAENHVIDIPTRVISLMPDEREDCQIIYSVYATSRSRLATSSLERRATLSRPRPLSRFVVRFADE